MLARSDQRQLICMIPKGMKMGEQTFLSLNLADLASLTKGARKRIVYGAPGVDQSLAVALVNASERLGEERVAVLLDVAE